VEHPDEFSVSLSLAQTLITWSYSCYRTGEFSRSVDVALEGVTVAKGLVEGNEELSEAWKLIGDAAYLASLVQVEGSKQVYDIASDILGITEEETLVDGDNDVEVTETKIKLLRCNVAAMEKIVTLTEGDRLAHSAAYFNLGLAKHRLATTEAPESSPSSVRPILECFKKAIQSEPRNFEYWNALGVVTARHFPSVAEKAFSRSLQINERVSPLYSTYNIEFRYLDQSRNDVRHARRRRTRSTSILTKSSE
jgi:superkiller protein 3